VRSGLSTLASLVIVDDEQALLAQHPGARRQDIARLAHALWDEVRDLEYDDQGHTVDQALSWPTIPSVVLSPQDLLLVCVEAKDLESTLLAERQRIDKALEVFRRMRAAAPVPAKA